MSLSDPRRAGVVGAKQMAGEGAHGRVRGHVDAIGIRGGHLDAGQRRVGRRHMSGRAEGRAAVQRDEQSVLGLAARIDERGQRQHARGIHRIGEGIADGRLLQAAGNRPAASGVITEHQARRRHRKQSLAGRRRALIHRPQVPVAVLAHPVPRHTSVGRRDQAEVGGQHDLRRALGGHEDAQRVGERSVGLGARAREQDRERERRAASPTASQRRTQGQFGNSRATGMICLA